MKRCAVERHEWLYFYSEPPSRQCAKCLLREVKLGEEWHDEASR